LDYKKLLVWAMLYCDDNGVKKDKPTILLRYLQDYTQDSIETQKKEIDPTRPTAKFTKSMPMWDEFFNSVFTIVWDI
jgi:hypothetical protein